MSGYGCAMWTGKGGRCLNDAKEDVFCPTHDPRNWCGSPTLKGSLCRRPKTNGTDRCAMHRTSEL